LQILTRRILFRLGFVAALLALTACSRPAQLPTLGPDSVVLAFGDSITYGLGAKRGEDYPGLLAQTSGWKVINAGVSGDTAQRAVSRIGPALAKHRPDLVIVELGGNDFLRKYPHGQVKENLRAILRSSVNSGAVTALVAVPSLSLLRASTGTLSDASLYAELAEEESVLLIPDVLADILSDNNLLADRIHPNAKGYVALSRGVFQALRSAGVAP